MLYSIFYGMHNTVIIKLWFKFLIRMTTYLLILHVLNSQNMANPTALLLSAVTMLRHLELNDKADIVQNAVLKTIAEGHYRTIDLGGKASTTDFTKAICDNL